MWEHGCAAVQISSYKTNSLNKSFCASVQCKLELFLVWKKRKEQCQSQMQKNMQKLRNTKFFFKKFNWKPLKLLALIQNQWPDSFKRLLKQLRLFIDRDILCENEKNHNYRQRNKSRKFWENGFAVVKTISY